MIDEPLNAAPSGTARSLLVNWANQQDAWIRELVSDVIVTGKAPSPERVEELYDMLLREKHLRDGEPVAVAKLRDDVSDLSTAEPLILNCLEDLKGVNALASGQSISFNPKLTIVFGENACGKTGYVRVLKRAAAVRTAEPILPNLDAVATTGVSPSAKIGFTIGTQHKAITWRDESGLAPLNRIDVFDARASALHVDADLSYIYTPGELVRFPLVQQGIDQVREALDRDIRNASTKSNPFVARFDRGSRLYPIIESLGAASDLAKLQALATVTDDERAAVPSLHTEIDALRSGTPQAQLKLAETHRRHLAALLSALDTINAFDVAAYDQAAVQLAAAQSEYENATRLSFAGLPIPGILQDEWRRFVQAGEDYLLHHGDPATFPTGDDVCTYCRQPLGPEAITLLRKYRDYCSGQFRAALDLVRSTVDRLSSGIRALDATNLRQQLAELTGNGVPLSAERQRELDDVLTHLAALVLACESGRPYEWAKRSEQVSRLQETVKTAEQSLATFIADLKDRSEKRQQTLREREAQLLDIESRIRLSELMEEAERFVAQAKWAYQAQIQTRRFQGILRSLTETSKTASEDLLNREFERCFTDECGKLRAPKVRLLFPGKQGQVSRRKALATDRRLSEVLSEGEQKVIALADFLAEIALKPSAPVVFDDPITSLDYRRMSEVIKRIVELSQQRQVVIFTHNIWFTTELLAQFEKRPQDCAYHDVTRDANRIGIISKGSHPRSDTYKSLKGKMNELLKAAERTTGEAQAALIEKGYEYLRNICEVIVESELFQGVTQRYQPNVRMTMLPNIKYDRLKTAADILYPIYEDCCRYIGSHSQPIETLNVRPSLAQFKADWNCVEGARDNYIKVS